MPLSLAMLGAVRFSMRELFGFRGFFDYTVGNDVSANIVNTPVPVISSLGVFRDVLLPARSLTSTVTSPSTGQPPPA